MPVTDYVCWKAIKLNLVKTPMIILVISSSSSSSNNNCH